MQRVNAAEAAAAVESRWPSPRIVVSGNHATPQVMVDALAAGVGRFRLWALNAQSGMPERDGITLETCFVGPGMRRSRHLRYIPARLSMVPVLFRDRLRPDVVVVHTSRVVDGKTSLGSEVNVLPAAIEQCRAQGGLLIAQVNQHMPYTYGDGEYDIDHFDLVVEADMPLADLTPPLIDDVSSSIGERVARHVSDGATLQLGIGAVPDAALPGVAQRRRPEDLVGDGERRRPDAPRKWRAGHR